MRENINRGVGWRCLSLYAAWSVRLAVPLLLSVCDCWAAIRIYFCVDGFHVMATTKTSSSLSWTKAGCHLKFLKSDCAESILFLIWMGRWLLHRECREWAWCIFWSWPPMKQERGSCSYYGELCWSWRTAYVSSSSQERLFLVMLARWAREREWVLRVVQRWFLASLHTAAFPSSWSVPRRGQFSEVKCVISILPMWSRRTDCDLAATPSLPLPRAGLLSSVWRRRLQVTSW